jgi:anti-sigma factor RsiW
MSCLMKSEEHAGRLLGYCAGELNAEAAGEVELHLKSCPECAAAVSAQAAVWKALDSWQPAPVSPDFDRRLFARIESEQAAPWWERGWERAGAAINEFLRPMFAQPAFPLSVAVIVIAAGFVLDHPAKVASPGSGPVAAHVSSIELDQVEASLEDMEMLHQFDATSDDQEGTAKPM